jgi:uncharacterized glyoxalase superfamily protein PhnB
MFETAIPIIRVSSSVAAEDFYCTRLGFKVLSSWRANATMDEPRYLTLGRDGARLHVHSFPSGSVGAGAVYVFVDDIDLLYADLVSRGVSMSGPPIQQAWGTREIVARDADQNVVTFGQRREASP